MKGFPAKISAALPLSISVLICVLTLAGYVGSFRYLEILSDYRPFLLALGLLGLLPAVVLRKCWPRIGIVTVSLWVATIVINGIEVLPWLLAHKPAPALSSEAATHIKAIAFNVEGVNTNYAGTRAFVEREAPDILMVCECNVRWSGELRSLTNQLPHHFRDDAMDIEVFSRYPFSRSHAFNFGPARGFHLLGIYLDGRREFGFVATHTYPRHWLGSKGFRWRTQALEEGLGKELHDFSIPLLVMGDLNASPWSPAYKKMIRSSGLQDARRGNGLLVTQHGHGALTRWLWRPIDHCLYSSGLEVTKIYTGPDLNSDHLPVVAEVRFKQE